MRVALLPALLSTHFTHTHKYTHTGLNDLDPCSTLVLVGVKLKIWRRHTIQWRVLILPPSVRNLSPQPPAPHLQRIRRTSKMLRTFWECRSSSLVSFPARCTTLELDYLTLFFFFWLSDNSRGDYVLNFFFFFLMELWWNFTATAHFPTAGLSFGAAEVGPLLFFSVWSGLLNLLRLSPS